MYLSVQLFGPLEVRTGENSPSLHFSAQKVKSLLCYLLLNRETCHSRDQLANLWWKDLDTPKARHCLSTAIWRLRQTLEANQVGRASFLISEDDTIRFNTSSDYWLDVDEFEKLCAQARQLEVRDDVALVTILRRAVTLYRSDLLPECYEEWCLVERQRLQQLHLFALNRLASAHVRRNEFTESIACYQKILVCDPLREEVHRELIRLYLKTSCPQEAVRQFNLCAGTLKSELGIEPMAETVALIRNLSTEDRNAVHLEIQQATIPASADKIATRQELQDILTHLSGATERIALANAQVQQALQQVKQLITHLDN